MASRRFPSRPLGITLVALAALLLAALFVPWEELLRRQAERMASDKLERTVRIGKLDLHWGLPLSFTLTDLSIANPEWAETPLLFRAAQARASVRLWPLISQRALHLPDVALQSPQLALEIDGERRSWKMGDGRGEGAQPVIDRLAVRDGLLRWRDPAKESAVDLRLETRGNQPEAAPLPAGDRLQATATGRFMGETVALQAEGGPVLSLRDDTAPYPLAVRGKVGGTDVEARGRITRLVDARSAEFDLKLAGPTLSALGDVFDVSIPDTPPYRLQGRLLHEPGLTRWSDLAGRIGDSQATGGFELRPKDAERPRPLLSADLRFAQLDFDDLGPLLGMKPRVGARPPKPRGEPVAPDAKVLPKKGFDGARWRKMDARVTLKAQRVLHAPSLPIDSFEATMRLDDGVMAIAPLRMGVAGGRIDAKLKLDGTKNLLAGNLDARFSDLRLQRLFPTLKRMEDSFGAINGQAVLAGRGASVSALLDTADGTLQFAMGRGRISNFLMEAAGLDGGELLKYLGNRDREIRVRCAVADLGLKDGVATTRTLLMDTDDSNIFGAGTIDLGREQVALTFRVEPKDRSILSLRAPLHVNGPLKKPSVRPDGGVLAGRVLGAIALGAINPLLALLPTIETGPGQDQDCRKVLAQAAERGAPAR